MTSHGRKHRRIRGVRILHEDADVIVVEKAAGVLSQATRCGASARVREHTVEDALGDWVRKGQAKSRLRVYLVHRLDRDTSGVMMVAKSEEVQDYFRSNWNELTEKTYLARVEGKMDAPSGAFESYLCEDPKTLNVYSVSDPARGKFARTEWEVLEEGRNASLVKVVLKSGRRNQIRVHFAEAGHPVCGDVRYGTGGRGLCLHAWRLSFVHPRTHETCTFEAPPPAWARTARRSAKTVRADEAGLAEAARVLNAGGVAVIPTDTVYGLAARPDCAEAVRRLYTIKGRAEQKPIALLAADADAAARFLGAAAADAGRRHWPGALTVVAQGEGVRVPDHAWTRRLIAACGGALRVTSANLSGRRAATDVPQALADVGLSADLVVDDGVSPGGVPSTVARIAPDGSAEILRPGPVSLQ